tara:strand:+ start:664 stop:1167 length:504 start_codon:yes stop_codon:yes gene_type:complete
MSIEIERRFLVEGRSWENNALSVHNIRQGYLTSDKKGWTTRIRIEDQDKAWLSIKSKSSDMSNNEFEYCIPINDAEEIWKLTKEKIYKTRYDLNLKRGKWIVDCFHKKNHPLIIAEVELTFESETIEKPEWCTVEITGKYRWSNAYLAKAPISIWPIKKRLFDPKRP